MTLTDDDLDKIRARDAKRKLKESNVSPETNELSKLLATIIYQRGVNNGSIYADWLAEELIKTGRIILK